MQTKKPGSGLCRSCKSECDECRTKKTAWRSRAPVYKPPVRHSSFRQAFSLLEVMIALGIFFAFIFTLLWMVSSILKQAQGLERPQVDVGLAASIFVNTNRFFEETRSGDFDDPFLRDYSWEANSYEAGSNGLVQADIILLKRGAGQPVDAISILVFDPNFKSGPFGGRGVR